MEKAAMSGQGSFVRSLLVFDFVVLCGCWSPYCFHSASQMPYIHFKGERERVGMDETKQGEVESSKKVSHSLIIDLSHGVRHQHQHHKQYHQG
jgi:hypothetical protein